MINFIINLPGPILTLILLAYLGLIVYSIISIGKSRKSIGMKVLLIGIMLFIPLSPIIYFLIRNSTKEK